MGRHAHLHRVGRGDDHADRRAGRPSRDHRHFALRHGDHQPRHIDGFRQRRLRRDHPLLPCLGRDRAGDLSRLPGAGGSGDREQGVYLHQFHHLLHLRHLRELGHRPPRTQDLRRGAGARTRTPQDRGTAVQRAPARSRRTAARRAGGGRFLLRRIGDLHRYRRLLQAGAQAVARHAGQGTQRSFLDCRRVRRPHRGREGQDHRRCLSGGFGGAGLGRSRRWRGDRFCLRHHPQHPHLRAGNRSRRPGPRRHPHRPGGRRRGRQSPLCL